VRHGPALGPVLQLKEVELHEGGSSCGSLLLLELAAVVLCWDLVT
jgi:hypothetical protein